MRIVGGKEWEEGGEVNREGGGTNHHASRWEIWQSISNLLVVTPLNNKSERSQQSQDK